MLTWQGRPCQGRLGGIWWELAELAELTTQLGARLVIMLLGGACAAMVREGIKA